MKQNIITEHKGFSPKKSHTVEKINGTEEFITKLTISKKFDGFEKTFVYILFGMLISSFIGIAIFFIFASLGKAETSLASFLPISFFSSSMFCLYQILIKRS